MPNPDILIPHTVGIDRAEGLAEAVHSRVDDLKVVVAHTPTETREKLQIVPAVVTVQFPTGWLKETSSLRWLHVVSAGVDQLNLHAFEEQGVIVTNSAGVHAEPIAEQVLCALLFFERGLNETVRNQQRGVWERVEGGEARDKTLGIVGVGAIGTRIAELGAAVGMEVIGTKRDVDDAPGILDEVLPAESYPEVLRRSEYVVLACPLTDETEDLIGAPQLAQMGSDTVLINIARGGVCVESDLIEALQQRVIRGAALDVFETEPLPQDSPLWDLSNVLVTPHMAGSSPNKYDRWSEIIITNYEAIDTDNLDDLQNRVA